MISNRGAQKFNRVTVTLVPTADDRSFRNVPSTYSALHRTYEWRKADSVDYLIVPRKISSAKIEVDVFLNGGKKVKLQAKALQRTVQDLVTEKIGSEWTGLRLGNIGRPTPAIVPQETVVRGSIEDILGISFDK